MKKVLFKKHDVATFRRLTKKHYDLGYQNIFFGPLYHACTLLQFGTSS